MVLKVLGQLAVLGVKILAGATREAYNQTLKSRSWRCVARAPLAKFYPPPLPFSQDLNTAC